MYKVLKVRRSGYNKFLNRKPSANEEREEYSFFTLRYSISAQEKYMDKEMLMKIFMEELPDLPCLRETVRKVMHENRLFASINKQHKYPVDNSNLYEFTDNKQNRNYKAPVKKLKWTGDITYIRTLEGWVSLAVVMDLYSRKIVGWFVSKRID